MEIKLVHVTKSFGAKQVIQPTSFVIQSGSLTTLLGPSGCGKTTLLRMIAGLETPDSGEIWFENRCVFSSEKKINIPPEKRGLGFVFQDFALWPHMTVFENVAFGLRAAGKTDKLDEKVKNALHAVQLDDFAQRYPHQLSGGQQQRVAIARALATNPKILLCDEATSALDPTTTRSILALLKEINKTLGITIIVITHEMAVIEEICQRVAIIDSSRIAEVGTVDEVFTRPKSAMAKQLIYPDGKRNSLATGKRYCRIVFDGNSSFEPVVSNMVLECKAPVNIMFADTKNIDGKAYGQMILQLPEDERAAKRALAYLETQNVHAEEVADYASV